MLLDVSIIEVYSEIQMVLIGFLELNVVQLYCILCEDFKSC